jgi:hypothetical protein
MRDTGDEDRTVGVRQPATLRRMIMKVKTNVKAGPRWRWW